MSQVCSVQGCTKPSRSRGMCPTHYTRWQRHGDPLKVRPLYPWPQSLLVRMDPQPDGCIYWTGPLDRDGYGAGYNGKRRTQAHRASYEHFVGPVPDGLQLDHVCHTVDPDCPGGRECMHRRCVNPAHLEPVTLAVNGARSAQRRRIA